MNLDDLNFRLPPNNLPAQDQHFLLYIPWEDRYLDYIPMEFRQYFLDCLPDLGVRTTDVHVAVCFGYFDRLVGEYESHHGRNVDRLVLGLGLILHDIGWSRLSQAEIAASLGISGLKLDSKALAPKEKHAVEGENIARAKLKAWGIPSDQADLVCECVRWHDQPGKVAGGDMPPEIGLLVDLDHIWSFTRLNFWLDVKRKGVAPAEYAANLRRDLDGYFITEEGKSLARELLEERFSEIDG